MRRLYLATIHFVLWRVHRTLHFCAANRHGIALHSCRTTSISSSAYTPICARVDATRPNALHARHGLSYLVIRSPRRHSINCVMLLLFNRATTTFLHTYIYTPIVICTYHTLTYKVAPPRARALRTHHLAFMHIPRTYTRARTNTHMYTRTRTRLHWLTHYVVRIHVR